MSLGTPTQITVRDLPQKRVIEGRSVVLEPLSQAHLDQLWLACQGAEDSFTYLRYGPFASKADLSQLIADLSNRAEQPFWAVRPTVDGKASGWLSLCDIYPVDASIEIGSIWFAPHLQRSRAARETLFLLMKVAMDDLAYQRLVWRCQAENQKSHDAALRLGFTFEGTWRNAAIVDGYQRGVAWFSILADEWPPLRDALEAWLSDTNFDGAGQMRASLTQIRQDATSSD